MRAKKLIRLLPYVAIGTIADCQSIVDPTNRAITKVGIQILKSGRYGVSGLATLVNELGLDQKIKDGYCFNSQDIAFSLSPILNSSGRISHARLSIMTLIGPSTFAYKQEKEEGFSAMAKKLISTNEERKKIVKDAVSQIKIDDSKNNIFLSGPWNKGVIGLIASRLVNKYQKPIAVVSKKNHIITKEEKSRLSDHIENMISNA